MSDDRINVTTAKKGIGIETTLCPNGVINVWSERGSGDVHSVHLDETGNVDRCTCKGYTHHGHCYHSDAIQQNGSLRSAARACSTRKLMTDGGSEEDDGDTDVLDMDDSERDVVEAYPDDDEVVDDTPL